MATLASLQDYYYTSMYPELKFLEEKRLNSVATLRKVALFLFILALISSFILISNDFFTPLYGCLISGMIAFVIYRIIYRHESAGYRYLFKDQVIEKIIYVIEPSLVYQQHNAIREQDYHQSELFLEHYDHFKGDDLVSGTIDGVDVRFCDLHVRKKEYDKKGKETWADIFRGLFFVADFNKTFHSKVIVLPDRAERTLGVFGSWMQSMNRQRGELIKLDHPEFEKFFVVYGSDQIESRYILSHALMDKIVQFRHQMNQDLSISFVDSKIFLALHYSKPLFEPILSRSLLEFSYIKEYFELLTMIVGIVKEFKLNEKLWSKHSHV